MSSEGKYFVLGLQSDNSLWAWGENGSGQLGNNSKTNSYTPVKLLGEWLDVAAGDNFSVGIRSDGSLWSWGLSTNGRLGLGAGATNKLVPTAVGTDLDWERVWTRKAHTYALKTDGRLYVWGPAESVGATAMESSSNTFEPKRIQEQYPLNFSSITARPAQFNNYSLNALHITPVANLPAQGMEFVEYLGNYKAVIKTDLGVWKHNYSMGASTQLISVNSANAVASFWVAGDYLYVTGKLNEAMVVGGVALEPNSADHKYLLAFDLRTESLIWGQVIAFDADIVKITLDPATSLLKYYGNYNGQGIVNSYNSDNGNYVSQAYHSGPYYGLNYDNNGVMKYSGVLTAANTQMVNGLLSSFYPYDKRVFRGVDYATGTFNASNFNEKYLIPFKGVDVPFEAGAFTTFDNEQTEIIYKTYFDPNLRDTIAAFAKAANLRAGWKGVQEGSCLLLLGSRTGREFCPVLEVSGLDLSANDAIAFLGTVVLDTTLSQVVIKNNSTQTMTITAAEFTTNDFNQFRSDLLSATTIAAGTSRAITFKYVPTRGEVNVSAKYSIYYETPDLSLQQKHIVLKGSATRIPQTITKFDSIPKQEFKTGGLRLDVQLSSGRVPVITSNSTTIARVVDTDSIAFVRGTGTASISVSHPGDTIYNPVAAVTRTFYISPSDQVLTVKLPDTTISVGQSFMPSYVITQGYAPTYSSADYDVVIYYFGAFTGYGRGTTTIYATQAGNQSWNPYSYSAEVTVLGVPAQVIWGNFPDTIALGDSVQLSTKINNSLGSNILPELSYVSSNGAGLSVVSEDVTQLKALKTGTYTITIRSDENAHFDAYDTTRTIYVRGASSGGSSSSAGGNSSSSSGGTTPILVVKPVGAGQYAHGNLQGEYKLYDMLGQQIGRGNLGSGGSFALPARRSQVYLMWTSHNGWVKIVQPRR